MELSSSKQAVIGIFGGSFDPIHVGHLALIASARMVLKLDKVLVMPAGDPWQKAGKLSSAHHRLAMVELALQGIDGVEIDTREMERSGPIYTIDTLKELRAEYGPDACLVMLIGSDQFHRLPTWKGWRELLSLVNIATTQRESLRLENFTPELEQWLVENGRDSLSADSYEAAHQPLAPHGRAVFFRMPTAAVSSTVIRQLSHLQQFSPAEMAALVPPAVIHYIQEHRLYQPNN